MITVDEFATRFDEEPGYLDFARLGPVGRTAVEEGRASDELLRRARFGTLDPVAGSDERVRNAVARLIRFRPDQVVFQPDTSTGLMHAMFGLTGTLALSPREYPSLTFAAVRAAEALQVVKPQWLTTDYGRVTPGSVRDQLDPACTAVAVSLVDFRTGYLVDLEGIRQVIGDRLLIVDAVQGFGVVDAPWEVADVIASGGQKWVRAGVGTGFLALSDRAVEQLTPVLSGAFSARQAAEDEGESLGDAPAPPPRGAAAFTIGSPNYFAEATFAAVLEEIDEVGVAAINGRIAEKISELIDLADEYAISVESSRAENERAGIVVLGPPAEQLTTLTASLFNHGITATGRDGRVRLSAHVSTQADTFEMVRGAFLSFATAINV